MIDSHAHIYADEFVEDLDQVVKRAQEAGVKKILLPNIDTSSVEVLNNVVNAYPDIAYRMMGLHPCSVKDDYLQQLASLKSELEKGNCIAVGEIGVDLYWDKSTQEIQIDAFRRQCEWAIAHDLPIVIHSRESIDLIIEIIEQHFAGRVTGVFHCFTGTKEQAERIMALGMYVGLGGVLTFKNSDLKHVVQHIPLDRIVLETDSPYLAPTPHRGKRNEPAYTQLVHNYLAELLQKDPSELDAIIEANTLRLFKI